MNDFDHDYVALLKRIFSGAAKSSLDRTGVGTISSFGESLDIDISGARLPITTMRKISWQAAVKEMLWMISGSTNIRDLLAEGVTIWTDWPLRDYIAASGEQITQEAFERRILTDDEFASDWGDLGPIYGQQWRNLTGRWPQLRRIDQLSELIAQLRIQPHSRRHILSTWNPLDIDRMTLPPCHMTYQFYVESDNTLSCFMHQRSCDVVLGLPFNLIGATVLTRIIAHHAGLSGTGRLLWRGGDVHVYRNQRDAVQNMFNRYRAASQHVVTPRLRIEHADRFDGYTPDNFKLEGYSPLPAIKIPVAV